MKEMLDGLYCEILKLKRKWYFTSISLVSLVCLFFVTLNKELVSSLNWYGYFSIFEFSAFSIFYAIVIPNFITLIFIEEFKDNTASIAFSYPNGRFGAFLNKFLMSILVIVIIYVTAFITIVFSGILYLNTSLSIAPLLNHSKVFLVSLVFQISIMPLTILVALIGKNSFISGFYSLFLMIGNANYLLGAKHKEYIFSILPATPIVKIGSPIIKNAIPIGEIITKLDIILGCFVFIVGFITCLIFYRKSNIY